MFFSRKKPARSYDPATQQPALRCSICTGEQTLGFRNLSTGSFQEVCLLRNQTDLDQFHKDYGIVGEIRKVY